MAKQGTKAAVPRLRFLEFRNEPQWETSHLGDICELYQPETIPSSSFATDGMHLVYGAGGVIGRLDRFNHEHAEVIIGCRGVCGNASLTEPKSWITGNAMVIRPKSDKLSKSFLFHLLDAADLSPVISGSAQPQITRQGLRRFSISAPAPAEQQKIADCLTSLDEVIAAQGRKVEALKAHKRGLMQQLFPREGETRPRLRFPEFRDAPEWGTVMLGDVCRPQQWQTISSSELTDSGYPVYGANGFIGYFSSYNHELETVAVTCRGSTCGEVLLIPPKSYITGNSMCLDDIDAAKHSYHFLFHLLKRRGFQDVISGSAQPQIVGQAIRKLKFSLPELFEQERIANCLSSLDTQITAESRQLGALKTHKQGLMQQLFPAPEAAGA